MKVEWEIVLWDPEFPALTVQGQRLEACWECLLWVGVDQLTRKSLSSNISFIDTLALNPYRGMGRRHHWSSKKLITWRSNVARTYHYCLYSFSYSLPKSSTCLCGCNLRCQHHSTVPCLWTALPYHSPLSGSSLGQTSKICPFGNSNLHGLYSWLHQTHVPQFVCASYMTLSLVSLGHKGCEGSGDSYI